MILNTRHSKCHAFFKSLWTLWRFSPINQSINHFIPSFLHLTASLNHIIQSGRATVTSGFPTSLIEIVVHAIRAHAAAGTAATVGIVLETFCNVFQTRGSTPRGCCQIGAFLFHFAMRRVRLAGQNVNLIIIIFFFVLPRWLECFAGFIDGHIV